MHLSEARLKAISEIFGNISVAWFAGGVIAPILVNSKITEDVFAQMGIGTFLAIIFGGVSVFSLK